MTQDHRTITADSLEIHRNPAGQVDTLTARGNPARYQGPLHGPNIVQGNAEKITYLPLEQKIILDGNAVLHQDDDTVEGPQIAYSIQDKVVLSSGQPGVTGRTTIIVQPR